MIGNIVVICAVLIIAFFAVVFIVRAVRERRYDNYRVVTELSGEGALSAEYVQIGEDFLRCSGDDVILMNASGQEIWMEPHMMKKPTIDVYQDKSVIYDKKNSNMSVYDLSGKIGEIHTKLPIIKAKVAKNGVVAAVLEDQDATWIRIYDVKGREIASAKTKVDSPGYPVDLSISSDGMSLAVTYLCVRAYKPSSYIVFYEFGDIGQNQVDNKVSAYTYTDTLVPAIKHLSNDTIVAFRDDGFTIYQGERIPEEKKVVAIEQNILSVFSDENHIGFVLKSLDKDKKYRIEIYDRDGELEWTRNIDIFFEDISISGDKIILHNKSEFAIYTLKGNLIYQGAIQEGNIEKIVCIERNRYRVITDQGYEQIKLV